MMQWAREGEGKSGGQGKEGRRMEGRESKCRGGVRVGGGGGEGA